MNASDINLTPFLIEATTTLNFCEDFPEMESPFEAAAVGFQLREEIVELTS